jgi:hypothetical protein
MRLELLPQDEDEGQGEVIDVPATNPNPTTFTSGIINQPATSASFQYFNVYPLSVAGTTVDWARQDEMMEVSVTFSFTHWQQVA